MKNSMKYISVAALMLAMASCESSDELNLSAYESDPNAVKINATIVGMAPQSRVNTIGNGDKWQEADPDPDQHIDADLIKVINTSANAINGKNEGVYKYEGNKWTPQGSDYMVWAGGTNTFEAFYPYTEGKNNSFSKFEIPFSHPSDYSLSKADWMTATATVAKTENKAVNLTFKHELVKVTMKIVKYNDQYSSVLSSLSLSYHAFTVPTTLTPIEGKTVTIEDNRLEITGAVNSVFQKSTLYSFTAILPPGKFNIGEKVFSLWMTYSDGNDDKTDRLYVNVPAGSVLTTGLEAGKAYTFNLTVGKNKVTISSVTVNEWGQGEAGSGGTAIEEQLP